MKQTKTILFILILAAFTSSCKREDTYYIVKGRLTTDCSGNPVANQELLLKQTPSIFGGSGGVLGSAITDANGNFAITYNSKDCAGGDDMRINLSGPIIEYIPTQQNIDIGTIVLSPICKIVYQVKINKPYTANDTLMCLNIINPASPIRIPAPLHDTILGIINASSMETLQYDTKDFSIIKGGWGVRSNSTIVSPGREVTIQVQNCNTVPDTLTMIID